MAGGRDIAVTVDKSLITTVKNFSSVSDALAPGVGRASGAKIMRQKIPAH